MFINTLFTLNHRTSTLRYGPRIFKHDCFTQTVNGSCCVAVGVSPMFKLARPGPRCQHHSLQCIHANILQALFPISSAKRIDVIAWTVRQCKSASLDGTSPSGKVYSCSVRLAVSIWLSGVHCDHRLFVNVGAKCW